ncbi:Asp-tRNA(Asn)/Glu-tRNA(Gln) amidotransferase GatCAB subunit B, partial [Chloroflexota bacterium]
GPASAIMNADKSDITEFGKRIRPEQFVGLLVLESRAVVNTATTKFVLEGMYKTGGTALDIIDERGLSQISDTHELEDTVSKVIEDNPQAVADYKAGKESALKFLVGQVMKATRGRANPQLVNGLLKKKLEGE